MHVHVAVEERDGMSDMVAFGWLDGCLDSPKAPKFASNLPEFRHPDQSTDIWEIAFDGKKCLDSHKRHIEVILESTLEMP